MCKASWKDFISVMRIKLDIPLRISEICLAAGAQIPIGVSPHMSVNFISTDSRECSSGDLFVALQGNGDSGERYVADALGNGCIALSVREGAHIIHVSDTARAFLEISKAYKKKVSPKYTVAVTGSVGKSTTVQFLATVLRQKYKVHSTIGNFNNHIGVPLTLLSSPSDTEILITELGMNHKGEISLLSRTVNPDIALITSVGTSHIGNLGSREGIAKAKLEILDGMTTGNILLPISEDLLSGIDGAIYVGRSSSLSAYSLNETGTGCYSFTAPGRTIGGIRFFDNREHLLHDLAFAISVADMVGMSEKEISDGVSAITEANLRQRFIELSDFTVFDDSYNASLESISEDLRYITSLGRPCGAFIGDVLELGDSTEEIHGMIGSVAAKSGVERLYLHGIYAQHIARGAIMRGMNEKCIFINTDPENVQASVEHIKSNHVSGEIILFKASHRLRFDKIADILKNEEGRQ